jgi:hypothetical protein
MLHPRDEEPLDLESLITLYPEYNQRDNAVSLWRQREKDEPGFTAKFIESGRVRPEKAVEVFPGNVDILTAAASFVSEHKASKSTYNIPKLGELVSDEMQTRMVKERIQDAVVLFPKHKELTKELAKQPSDDLVDWISNERLSVSKAIQVVKAMPKKDAKLVGAKADILKACLVADPKAHKTISEQKTLIGSDVVKQIAPEIKAAKSVSQGGGSTQRSAARSASPPARPHTAPTTRSKSEPPKATTLSTSSRFNKAFDREKEASPPKGSSKTSPTRGTSRPITSSTRSKTPPRARNPSPPPERSKRGQSPPSTKPRSTQSSTKALHALSTDPTTHGHNKVMVTQQLVDNLKKVVAELRASSIEISEERLHFLDGLVQKLEDVCQGTGALKSLRSRRFVEEAVEHIDTQESLLTGTKVIELLDKNYPRETQAKTQGTSLDDKPGDEPDVSLDDEKPEEDLSAGDSTQVRF